MTDLPPRLHRAKTIKVLWPHCIEADIELDFGVHVRRVVHLEGLDAQTVPSSLVSRAKHALVVLIGGKNLIINTEPTLNGSKVVGRLYLDVPVYGNPPGMTIPPGLDQEMLEVSEFFLSLRKNGFNKDDVLSILNRNHAKKVQS